MTERGFIAQRLQVQRKYAAILMEVLGQFQFVRGLQIQGSLPEVPSDAKLELQKGHAPWPHAL